MIHETTPQLDPQRISQMIETAMSYKQTPAKVWRPFRQHPFAFGIGALAAASIAAVMWLGPINTPQQTPKIKSTYVADVSEGIMYDLLDDLGA